MPESGGTLSERAAKESGLRENRTSRLSERAEVGRKPRLSRLYSEEGSVMELERRRNTVQLYREVNRNAGGAFG